MPDQTQLKEMLSELTGEVAESVTYLRELGVEGLESSVDFPARVETRDASSQSRAASPAPTVPLPRALERNARAEGAGKPPPRIILPPPPRRAGGETTKASYQSAMPKKPVRPPSPNPPAPRETLFGEIAPKDELSLGRPGETFDDIRDDIGECIRCPLHQGRTKIVHTEGNRQARLMFVGEAPGADEDASGRPFVGRAGQLLNKIIEAIGLKREDVLIGNVNRCRPPGNRAPTTEEAATCKPFLLREINVARPDVIIVLGNTAMKNLLDTREGITRLRGNFQDYKGIKVMPTFHPAYLLRDPSKKREVWDDMKKVRDYLNENKKS
ncbi:MAG: uracil-DNA glycosylase [Acidobacteria bacterium]|nr:uracil-DNA glycosylase [Acidobacteriota bacterium]